MNRPGRAVDALRAVAILGVVLGDWMVSAVVADPDRLSLVHLESPLASFGPLIFAGGYAAAMGLARRPTGTWLRTSARRLVRPMLPLALVWVPALLLLGVAGAPARTRHTVESLVTQPLWGLLAYLLLTALTPLRPALTGVLEHSNVWLPVAALNRAALTILLWHQTAMLLVTFGGLLAGRPAGLLDEPVGAWPLHRLAWLPVFALVLAVLVTIFHRFEAGASKMSVGAGTIVGSDADHQRREEGQT